MTKKKYEFRLQFIGDDGLKHDIKANTKKELDEKVRKLKNDIDEGYSPLKSSSVTVQKWFDKCLSEYKTNVSEQTLTGYKSKVNSWIIPVIGHMRIKDVRPLDCQAVMNRMQGKAADTIRKVRQIMFFCFDKAVENHFIRNNPATHITAPKGCKTTHRIITEHERSIILKTIENCLHGDYIASDGRYRDVDTRYRYVYFLFILMCGCRPSEVANIQAFDIKDIQGVHVLHIRGTKTDNADRLVPIPDYLYERIPPTDSPFAYLFTNMRGGKLSPSNRQALWREFKRDLNITAGCRVYRNALVPPYPIAADLTPYCLRHTYCTDLELAGIDVGQASHLMGHGDVKLTANLYTHQTELSVIQAARKMSNAKEKEETEEETIPQTIEIMR